MHEYLSPKNYTVYAGHSQVWTFPPGGTQKYELFKVVHRCISLKTPDLNYTLTMAFKTRAQQNKIEGETSI